MANQRSQSWRWTKYLELKVSIHYRFYCEIPYARAPSADRHNGCNKGGCKYLSMWYRYLGCILNDGRKPIENHQGKPLMRIILREASDFCTNASDGEYKHECKHIFLGTACLTSIFTLLVNTRRTVTTWWVDRTTISICVWIFSRDDRKRQVQRFQITFWSIFQFQRSMCTVRSCGHHRLTASVWSRLHAHYIHQPATEK